MLARKGKTSVLIVNFSGRGGLAHHVYFLCNALAQLEVDFILLTTRDFELAKQCSHFRCETGLLSHYRRKSNAGKGAIYGLSLLLLLFYILRHKPSVVHLQELKIPFIEKRLLRYLRKRGIKLIFTAHDLGNTDSAVVAATPALREVYQLFDYIVAHTDQNKALIAQSFNVDANRIVMLPVGEYTALPDQLLDRAVARKSLGIAGDRQVVLFFGYIRKYKGLDLLLEALALVRQSLPKIFLIVAGEAKDDFDVYRRLIDGKGLGEIVRLDIQYVPLDQMAAYFGAADVVALPYRRVFQSGLVRLAYAYKRPVLATQVGDLPMIVENGKTGYLIPPHSVNSLAEAIKLAFADSERLHEMGERAYLWVREKFSWAQIARGMAKIYGEAVTGQVDTLYSETRLSLL
jgi:glycosyltransferase involved in cell wall biosynthesis